MKYITCLSSINIGVTIPFYYTYPHFLVHFIVTTEYIADMDKSLGNVSSSKIWNPAFLYNAMAIGILITLMLLSSFLYPFTDPLEAYHHDPDPRMSFTNLVIRASNCQDFMILI